MKFLDRIVTAGAAPNRKQHAFRFRDGVIKIIIVMAGLTSSIAPHAEAENQFSEQRTWITPIDGYYVISPFKDRDRHSEHSHQGADVIATHSTRLLAPAAGIVIVSADRDLMYGSLSNVIVIDHGDDLVSVFANVKQRKVKVGQTLQAGQSIGNVWGISETQEQHFTHMEVIYRGKSIDPFLKIPYRFFDLELPPRGLY
jgi:murein DD-endopeptidase MepM/ murein hydrolase activator NlpD